MPAGAGEGDGVRSYHGSGARKSASASEEFIVGELEEGLRVPLLSGREKSELEYDDAGSDSGSDGEPCAFLDLFVLADMVRSVREGLHVCVVAFGTHVFVRNFLQMVRWCQPPLSSSVGWPHCKIGMRRRIESERQAFEKSAPA